MNHVGELLCSQWKWKDRRMKEEEVSEWLKTCASQACGSDPGQGPEQVLQVYHLYSQKQTQ